MVLYLSALGAGGLSPLWRIRKKISVIVSFFGFSHHTEMACGMTAAWIDGSSSIRRFPHWK
jgi:hypothetical protein